MYFEDAIGNQDTLTLGYDLNGTDTIDSIFGEININDVPLDSSFDVRISNFLWAEGDFQIKKQIVNNNCPWFNHISIEFSCNNWPVTASWDESLFTDSCRNGSVLTSVHPGFWWDNNGPSDLYIQELSLTDQVTFSSNTSTDGLDEYYNYVTDQLDTISVFWFAFADSTLLSTSIIEIPNNVGISVYPNPASELIQIKLFNENEMIKDVQLFDFSGKELKAVFIDDNLNISHLKNGIYIIQVQASSGFMYNTKIIKE
jgi:hypothetical protein